MSVSYEGIGSLVVTFHALDCEEGKVCKLDEISRAINCQAGDEICGVVLFVKNHMAAVQVEGFVTLSYSGSLPAVGYTKLAADGNGGMMVSENGREHLVIQSDPNTKKIVIKL